MKQYETILVECSDGVGTITMNRVNKLNAMNKALRAELADAIAAINADDSVRVGVLAAAGRGFSVGMELDPNLLEAFDVRSLILKEYKPGLMAIYDAPKPWISAVNGPAAGIGASYAMACDLTVMAEDAYMLEAFAAIGLVPDGGASWHMVHSVGRKRAYELIVSGKKIAADQCLALGLCNRVVPADSLLAETRTWALELAAKAPLALRYSKQALRFSQDAPLSEAVDNEADLQKLCVDSDDGTEGIKAFMEKRAPQWKGC